MQRGCQCVRQFDFFNRFPSAIKLDGGDVRAHDMIGMFGKRIKGRLSERCRRMSAC